MMSLNRHSRSIELPNFPATETHSPLASNLCRAVTATYRVPTVLTLGRRCRFRQLADHFRYQQRRNIQSWFGGLPLMTEEITKVGMRLAHPGEFIREEILAELDLSVARAAEI